MTLTHLEVLVSPYGEPTQEQLGQWCQTVDDALCLQLELSPPVSGLLVTSPYDDIYFHYAVAQLENNRRQYGDYANAMAHYNSLFQSFCGRYRKHHTPTTVKSILI